MPKKQPGDLSHVFETPVPNLEWLDVDEEAYRHLERLPKQNLDAVPDLVDAWTHHDMGTVRRVPSLDPDYVREHKWANDLKQADEAKVRELVVAAVKERLKAGWDSKRLASWVRENVHPDHIQMLIPTLQRVAQEHAMLGQMERTLEFDIVPPDEAAIDEYKARLDIPDDGDYSELDSFLSTELPTERHDLRTPLREGNQQARDRRASGLYEPPEADFQSAHERELYRDLSQKMMAAKGYLSDSLTRRFARADSEAVAVLAQEENLLGSVYVRPDQFRNCHSANDFFRRHSNDAEYILAMDKCGGCQFHRNGGCSLIGKRVAKEIPYTEEVLRAEVRNLRDAGTLDKASAENILSRIGSEDVRDLLAEAHGVRAPVQIGEYRQKYETAQMGRASDGVSSQVHDNYTGVPLKHASVVRAAYQAAYRGVHGDRLRDHLVERYGRQAVIQAVIQAGEHIRPVVRMAGLLGNLILDMRGFRTAKEASDFLYDNRMRPLYLLKEGSGCGGCAPQVPDYSKNFPALTIVNYGSIDEIEVDCKTALEKLVRNDRITAARARELTARIGSTSDFSILRDAYLSPRPAPNLGPERKARAVAPKRSKKQIRREFKQAQDFERASVRQNLLDLIKKQADADTIAAEFAANITKHVRAEDFDKKQVLRHLAEEEVRYASEKKRIADEGWIDRIRTLDVDIKAHGEIDVPAVDTSAVRKAQAARISSTMRTAFRQRLVMAMNKGLHGDDLKSWLRNSFEERLIRDQASFIRKALEEQGKLGLHYIDPKPYTACDQGARQVADSPAQYVQAMDKCAGCVFKSANNRCQVYDREVVAEVPEMPTVEQELRAPSPVGLDPSLEYGLGSYLGVEINEAGGPAELDIGFDDPLGELT